MGRIAGQRKGEPYPEAKHASGGSNIESAPVTVTFSMVNGLQRFNAVAVPDLPIDALPWASLDGDSIPGGETVGVCGCKNNGDGTVDLAAIYNGGLTSVDVLIRVFWVE